MTNHAPLCDPTEVLERQEALSSAGVKLVIGTLINVAGITLAKSVPLARLDSFHRSGMGAAPAWQVFCIDGGIAFTGSITAVGDLRLRIDMGALRDIGGGIAWSPVNMFNQDGTPSAACPRGLLSGIEDRLAFAGLRARVGHELEFALVNPDGSALARNSWVPYGATGLLDHEAFLADLLSTTQHAGLHLEQLHCEYGRDQFEFSLPPLEPVAAADAVVLARLLVGRAARRHNLAVSFSPVPFVGAVGNGAHQHFSLARDGESLFSDGTQPHGITTEGGAAIGGVLRGLPEIQGLLTGSILSGARLAPGMWSGAHVCWGVENREAAVRFLAGGASNPQGANMEVKIVDPSANPYIASAAILALALDGITSSAPLPTEVPDDPSKISDEAREEAGVTLLPGSVDTIIDALDKSQLARELLSAQIVDATVATRRHEQANHGDASPEELADRFRLAWSI